VSVAEVEWTLMQRADSPALWITDADLPKPMADEAPVVTA